MNVLVVDTSSWITYFNKGRGDDLDLALREGRVYLSPVVAAELMSGKMKRTDRVKLAELLRDIPLCYCDIEHWIRVGELRTQLQARGYAISTPDAHVAQCALDLGGYLVSEDSIFSKIAKVTPLRLLG